MVLETFPPPHTTSNGSCDFTSSGRWIDFVLVTRDMECWLQRYAGTQAACEFLADGAGLSEFAHNAPHLRFLLVSG
jgi:hypothetical protein